MNIRTPMNRSDIERLTQLRHELAEAAAEFDKAHRNMAAAIQQMDAATRGIDFFLESQDLTRFRRNLPKTKSTFNGITNYAPSLNAARLVELTDEALAKAWL